MRRRSSCLDCVVREGALCRTLGVQELADLSRRSFHKSYPAGRLIAGIAASEDWCATILTGVVKLTKSLPDGRQQIVGLLFPSDFLGRPFKAGSPYTAETATTVELCCYNRSYFEQLLASQPDMKQLFLERTLDAVDAARDWMLLLGCKSASEKVAALLLMIARRVSPVACAACSVENRQGIIELPLSRSEMAEYLGLRLETVSRQLQRLETRSVIKRLERRRLAICDIHRLEQMAG